MNNSTYISRVKGSLLGLHAGDSLGATLEFGPPKPKDDFLTQIIGNGPFNWSPGDPTDDTSLMIALLKGIESSKKINFEAVALNFLNWYHSNPPDIGKTTKLALENLDQKISYKNSGIISETSKSNGSLMRCAPLALLDLEEASLQETVYTQSAITHANEINKHSDWIFINALKLCFQGHHKEKVFSESLSLTKKLNPEIYNQLKSTPSLEWKDLSCSGFVVDTLCSSFWGLLKTENFKDAVVQVANRGDDSDTCGAVTGALCGAYYEEKAIPKEWLLVLKEKNTILSELNRIFSL